MTSFTTNEEGVTTLRLDDPPLGGHTLGPLLQRYLLERNNREKGRVVTFASYRVVHPLESALEVQWRTSDVEGEIIVERNRTAMLEAIYRILADLRALGGTV